MIYSLARSLVRIYISFFHGWEIIGKNNIPLEGPLIVVANHSSNWEPPILGCFMDRRVYFMAKEEFFRIPLVGQLFRSLGAFPVKRGTPDRRAIKKALRILEQGKVLGLFPEGTRNRTGKLLEPQPGVALLAIKSGAPVLPVAIKKKGRGFQVLIGELFYPETGEKTGREELHLMAKSIMARIGDMLDASD